MGSTPGAANLSNNSLATIALSVFDGTRQLISDEVDLLLRVRDGQKAERFSNFVKGPRISIQVPFSDNFVDNYTVLVSADKRRDAGFFPVKVSPSLPQSLDLMLVSNAAEFRFLEWPDFKANYRLL